MKMNLSRRALLAAAGGTVVGLAGVNVLGQAFDDTAAILEEWSNHQEEFHVSICKQCPGGCGILVRVIDGTVVKIAGNPFYPVNRGGLCMKGLTGGEVLYDPDRIRSPLVRTGPRGSGQFEPISWEDALAKVAGQLQSLRQQGQAHTFAVLGGQYRGLMGDLLERFCRAYGTPNYLRYRCLTPEKATAGHYYQHGLERPLSYDLQHARYVLSFGCNLLESWQSTVHQAWAYGKLRQVAEGQRAPLVQVDTRYSVTAAKADLWVPIKPGTDGALALGLAHIMIQEGLYDREFVQERTFGFLDWKDGDGQLHPGFRSLVLEAYPPEKVARLTGVPVELLYRLARGFGTNKPALALGEKGPPFHAADLYTRMAIHSLNALVGSIGREGGIFLQGQVPLAPWPSLPESRNSERAQPRIDRSTNPLLAAESDLSGLAANLASGEPYRTNLLFLYYTNPLFSLPEAGRWRKALDGVQQVVSFSPFMDETTQYADLILPDSTYLERWQDDEVSHLAGFTSFGIGRPVVPPLYDTRQSEDVIIQLAQALDKPIAAAFPWKNFEALLRDKAQGLFEARRGHIVMGSLEEDFEAILARQGYWERQFNSFDEFWNALLERGAWWDPNDSYVGQRQLFRTPSGKFEFFSQLLKRDLAQAALQTTGSARPLPARSVDELAAAINLSARGDLLYLPHFEESPLPQDAAEYPYHLNTYKLMSQTGGRAANQPRLQQQIAVHVEGGWGNWVEINSEVAAGLGIGEGDWVWLESSQGRIRVRAKPYAGAMPDVVNMPFGQGHSALGRWAKDRGENPNDILVQVTDPFRGVPVWGATRVRLVKA